MLFILGPVNWGSPFFIYISIFCTSSLCRLLNMNSTFVFFARCLTWFVSKHFFQARYCLKSLLLLLQLQDMTHCFFKIYGSCGIHIFCSGRTVQFRFWFRLGTFSPRLRNLCQISLRPKEIWGKIVKKRTNYLPKKFAGQICVPSLIQFQHNKQKK